MAMSRPGSVTADREAFAQIASRFRDEVGGILGRLDFDLGPVPFWAVLRTMFPVAEALGSLVYAHRETTRNLSSVLENEFEAVRVGYRDRAALLALLYRHSLVHQDELRVIRGADCEVGWHVSGDNDSGHLLVAVVRPNTLCIQFQPRAFYEDILAVADRAADRDWKGEVMRRYNAWTVLDVDTLTKNGRARALREIARLVTITS